MERKFTDDEILKALECICGNVLFCADCPYSKTFNQPMRCKEMCAKDALDLINRQKAEIQRLNFENLQMIASIKHLKSEAIKEFADMIYADNIDTLVKETMGENNGN